MGVKLNPFTGKLDVVDSPSGDFSTVELNLGTEGSPSIAFDSDSNTGIYSPGADQVAISTGGTGRVFVDANGHVGINEASPSTYSAGAGVPGFVLKGNSGSHADRSGGLTLVSQDGTTAKTWIYHDTDLFIQSTEATNTRFYTNNSPRLYITSTGELKHIGGGTEGSPGVYFAGSAPSNSLYVQATTGKVGLGTSSPATDLHLSNTTGPVFRIGASGGVANAASTGRIEFYGGSTAGNGPGIKAVIDTESTTGTARDFDLLFKTSPNVGSGEPLERLRIAANGNVGIGATSPSYVLDATANATGGIRYKSTGSYGYIVADNTGTTGGGIFNAQQNGVQKAVFGVTGGLLGDTSADAAVFADSGQAIRFYTNGSNERARIDSSGRLLVGTSVALTNDYWGQGQIQLANNNGAIIQAYTYDSSSTNGSVIELHRARGTQVSPSNPLNNDLLGEINFYGYNSSAGTPFQRAAAIRAFVDGTPGNSATDMPGRLVFSTTPDGDSDPDPRMTIKNDGKVGIGTESPAAPLEVRGSGNTTINSYGNLFVADGGTAAQASQEGGQISFGAWLNGDLSAPYPMGAIKGVSETSATNVNTGALILCSRPQGGVEEAVRIDSSKRLLVGTNTSRNVGSTVGSRLQVEHKASNGVHGLSVVDTHDSAQIAFGTNNNNSACLEDKILGRINFCGNDGTDLQHQSAWIQAVADGDFANDDVPGRLEFSTTADGNPSPTERMRITQSGDFEIPVLTGTTNTVQVGQRLTGSVSDGNGSRAGGVAIIRTPGTGGGTTSGCGIGFYISTNTYSGYSQTYANTLGWYIKGDGDFLPGIDNTNGLGNASYRCSELFAAVGTVNTSDINEKQDIRNLEQAELEVAKEIKGLIKAYRWIHAVEKKGDEARIHIGVMAQEIEEVFSKHNLDASDYGLWCSDTWHEIDGQVVYADEDGNYPEGAIERTRLGVRYDQLLAFVIAVL